MLKNHKKKNLFFKKEQIKLRTENFRLSKAIDASLNDQDRKNIASDDLPRLFEVLVNVKLTG